MLRENHTRPVIAGSSSVLRHKATLMALGGISAVTVSGTLMLTALLAASCGDSGSEASLHTLPDAGPDAAGDAAVNNTDDAASDVAPDSHLESGGLLEADAPLPDSEGRVASDDADVEAGSVATDATADAPHPVSQFCGDGIRDPALEECDDGTAGRDDSCTSACTVTSLGVVPASGSDAGSLTGQARTLGVGRHVASAGAAGFGVVYTDLDASLAVRLQPFDEWGGRSADSIDVSAGLQPAGEANPVVAALSAGNFVVIWTDSTAGTPDVAMRRVQPGVVPSGAPKYPHDVTAGAQRDADVLWTGSELVVAWSDLFSVKYRTFSEFLSARTSEQTLSLGSEFSGNVSLAARPLGGGWAAAWRVGDQGLESIAVRVANASWVTESFLPATAGDHPALVELDAAHLLLFFSAGPSASGGVARLRIAVLDVSASVSSGSGSITSQSFVPLTAPYSTDTSLTQSRPAAARVGDRIFVSWQTKSPLGDPLQAEVFVAEIGWSATTADVIEVHEQPKRPATHRCHYWPWARLLKRSLAVDGEKCDACGARMKLRALVIAARSIERLLGHLGEPTEPPPLSPARGPRFFKSRAVRRKMGDLDAPQGVLPMFGA